MIIRKNGLIISALLITFTLSAQNPIVKNLYTADPAAMVYQDRVYIYTGHDIAGTNATFFDMRDWYVFSSSDMVNWTNHGARLTLSTFAWARSDAWAGHVVERNGKFYWYVTVTPRTGGGFAIGVAVGDSPTGPFKDALGKPLITDAMTPDVAIDIDPAVFIDTDGKAYLYWGNAGANRAPVKMLRLKANMIETEGAMLSFPVNNFTEAAYVHKRNNTTIYPMPPNGLKRFVCYE